MDYKKLGFKCGIEIHQQLETGKLFCNCPSLNLRDNKPDVKFERRLRAVVGETGEIDAAAAHEMAKAKKFIYESCSEDTCEVDFDEEPPHPINPDAVKVTAEICMMLNAQIVDEIQVMRKTVVDGSNVSGFQRTALVGRDGFIETSTINYHQDTASVPEPATMILLGSCLLGLAASRKLIIKN